MSTMLFSGTGYNKLGVRLFLLVPSERGNLGSRVEQDSKEKSLAEATNDARTWLDVCSNRKDVQLYEVKALEQSLTALRKLVEGIKQNIPEGQQLPPQVQEADTLAAEIETRLPSMKLKGAINHAQTWFGVCSNRKDVQLYEVKALEQSLTALLKAVKDVKNIQEEGQSLSEEVQRAIQEAENLATEIKNELGWDLD